VNLRYESFVTKKTIEKAGQHVWPKLFVPGGGAVAICIAVAGTVGIEQHLGTAIQPQYHNIIPFY
jgi:hypothetical protein